MNDNSELRLFTIGFAKKTAEQFFNLLMAAGVRRVIDIRLKNVSQLAGFTKRDDLRYFLRAIASIDYRHEPALAPTEAILAAYKGKKGNWPAYERSFLALLKQRRPEELIDRPALDHACLLCSEPAPELCHRRLVAEYLRDRWPGISVIHL